MYDSKTYLEFNMEVGKKMGTSNAYGYQQYTIASDTASSCGTATITTTPNDLFINSTDPMIDLKIESSPVYDSIDYSGYGVKMYSEYGEKSPEEKVWMKSGRFLDNLRSDVNKRLENSLQGV